MSALIECSCFLLLCILGVSIKLFCSTFLVSCAKNENAVFELTCSKNDRGKMNLQWRMKFCSDELCMNCAHVE